MKQAFRSFLDGDLSVNEFAVLTALLSRTNGNAGAIKTTAPEISTTFRGELSRHAVARALRNLQKDNWLTWSISGRNSTITVN